MFQDTHGQSTSQLFILVPNDGTLNFQTSLEKFFFDRIATTDAHLSIQSFKLFITLSGFPFSNCQSVGLSGFKPDFILLIKLD